MINNTDLAYIAGIVDGEGCLTLTRSANKKYIQPSIVIAMSDKHIIEFINSKLGGSIYVRIDKRKETYKTIYYLKYGSQDNINNFLGTILPFLKGKKRQAEIMLEFIKLRKPKKRGRKNNTTYTESEWNLLKNIQALNKR